MESKEEKTRQRDSDKKTSQSSLSPSFIKSYKSRYSTGSLRVSIPFKSEAIAAAKQTQK